MSLRGRRLQPEVMDDPGLDPAEHDRALRRLAWINRASRAAGPIARAIEATWRGAPELALLDIGTGSGDVAIAVARRLAARGARVRLILSDLSPRALEAARARAVRAFPSQPTAQPASASASAGQAGAGRASEGHGGADHAGARWADAAGGAQSVGAPAARVRVETMVLDASRAPWPIASGSVDVAMCSLFLHHLREDDVVAVLREMARVARIVVASDLRRSRTGWLAAWAVGALSGSRVVRVDAPRSVEGALTSDELETLARRAGLGGATVHRVWPWRMLLSCGPIERPPTTPG